MPSCSSCANEALPSSLKGCAGCKSVAYCNKDCQKAHWKVHKKDCARSAGGRGPTKGLSSTLPLPFANIRSKTWLHNRPEEDTFKLLIDIYRLRADDEFNFQRKTPPDSLYGGARSGIGGFEEFLRLASRPNLGVLPPWWNDEAAEKCKEFGKKTLKQIVDKAGVIDEYGQKMMPMQMRMVGEDVYGTNVTGESSGNQKEVMLSRMCQLEAGNSEMGYVSHIDMS
ncbi:hypothetical protein FKW77_005488 [Venturia effusa]|uniref:MYND-type domain-containing protein n=1 Tax=Venturia effusa TaxID=50376 RepID=A0A517LN07_9PEZI|nr:hypothetical protein FKW77_005488 [Venturia effusa]